MSHTVQQLYECLWCLLAGLFTGLLVAQLRWTIMELRTWILMLVIGALFAFLSTYLV